MNAIENEQVCKSAEQALRHGVGKLSAVPGLIAKIIETRAWECREVRPGVVVELGSLLELVTRKPPDGWGEDPAKVERLLSDHPKVLAQWREHTKQQGRRTDLEGDLCSNPTEVRKNDRGRAYTLERLEREAPELFERVCEGALSANAAAIEAGFRKKPSNEERCLAAFRKAENRLNVLRHIVAELEQSERNVLIEWLSESEA